MIKHPNGHTWFTPDGGDPVGLSRFMTADQPSLNTGFQDNSWADMQQKIAGLQQSSFTVTGTFDSAAYFPPVTPPLIQVTYSVPASRWQTFKHRLKVDP